MHAIGNEESHFHALISWTDFFEAGKLVAQLKGALSHHLGQKIGSEHKWFSRGASEKRVLTQDHFTYLVETYLPSHGGIFWKEGQPLP